MIMTKIQSSKYQNIKIKNIEISKYTAQLSRGNLVPAWHVEESKIVHKDSQAKDI